MWVMKMYFLIDEVVEKLQKLTALEEHDDDVTDILNRFKENVTYNEMVEIRNLIDSKLNSSVESSIY